MTIMLVGLKTVVGFGDDGKPRPSPWKDAHSYLFFRKRRIA